MKALTDKEKLYLSVINDHNIFDRNLSDSDIIDEMGLNDLSDIDVNPLELFHAALKCENVPMKYIRKAIFQCTPFTEIFKEYKKQVEIEVLFDDEKFLLFVSWVCENIKVIAQYECLRFEFVVLLHEDDGLLLYIEEFKSTNWCINGRICAHIIQKDDYVKFYTKEGYIEFCEDVCLVGAEITGDETGGHDTKGGEEVGYICGAKIVTPDYTKVIRTLTHEPLESEDDLTQIDIQNTLIDCLFYINEK